MKEFKKWFLVGLILVLVIGCNVGCKEEQPIEENPVIVNCFNNIFNRILSQLSEQEKRNLGDLKIQVMSTCYRWATLDYSFRLIFINAYLLLVAEKEAEIAFVIAHELGHDIIKGDIIKSHNTLEKEKLADLLAVKLMARAGYNTLSAADILQRIIEVDDELFNYLYEDIAKDPKWEEENEERMICLHTNAGKYFKEDQKNWISISSYNFEKTKELVNAEKRDKDFLKLLKSTLDSIDN